MLQKIEKFISSLYIINGVLMIITAVLQFVAHNPTRNIILSIIIVVISAIVTFGYWKLDHNDLFVFMQMIIMGMWLMNVAINM